RQREKDFDKQYRGGQQQRYCEAPEHDCERVNQSLRSEAACLGEVRIALASVPPSLADSALRNRSASLPTSLWIECRWTTRVWPALPIFSRSGTEAVRLCSIALARSSTEPAGKSQPVSPGTTSSGIPAIYVVSTGRRSAIASMITTGKPSAKLGSTRA